MGDLDFTFPEGTHAVGRLDSHSEGLLILTTNKKVTRLLFEGPKKHERTYLVLVRHVVTEAQLQQLQEQNEQLRNESNAKDGEIANLRRTIEENERTINGNNDIINQINQRLGELEGIVNTQGTDLQDLLQQVRNVLGQLNDLTLRGGALRNSGRRKQKITRKRRKMRGGFIAKYTNTSSKSKKKRSNSYKSKLSDLTASDSSSSSTSSQ